MTGGIRHAAGRVTVLTGLGMAAGLAVDVLMAMRLGATGMADALILGLTIPLVLETILREGSKFSLVPLMIAQEEGLAVPRARLSGLLNIVSAAGIAVVVLGVVSAPALIGLLGRGLSVEEASLAMTVLQVSMPLVALSMVSNCLAAYLNAQHRFGYAAVRYLAVSSTVLVGASLVVRPEQFVLAIAVFYVLGYLLYVFALWLRARHLGWRHSWQARLPREDLVQIWRQLSWPTGGFLLGQSMRVVERGLASSIAPGAVALYYFAFRVFNAVRNLIGMSLATVILPGLVRRHAANSAAPLGSSVLRPVGLALLFLVPTCLVLVFFAEPVVHLLFGRGEFAGPPVEGAADVLRVLAVALLFFGLTPVLMSVLYARRQQKTIFMVMAGTAFVNLALALILTAPYGLMGIAAAFAGAAVINVSLVSFFARRDVSNG